MNSWKHSPFLYWGNVVGHGTEDKGLAASLIDTSSFTIMALKWNEVLFWEIGRQSVSGPTSPVSDYFAVEAHIDLYNLILCFSLFV